jgi:AcrR family transcriptional regulator
MRSGSETRRRLVDAAERVIRDKGLARATTKEIAREAGCAEGTLYLHFADKLDLVRAVHEKFLPSFVEVAAGTAGRAGSRTVRANLVELAEGALSLYRDLLPLGSSMFAAPDLLERYRTLLRARGAGPHRAIEPVVAYLEAEQALGRVPAGADLAAAAVLLLGACHQVVFVEQMVGQGALPLGGSPAARLVDALLAGLTPARPTDRADTEDEA